MTTRSPPPALEPYLRLPPETSLILLTSTLGCSVNWLTARFIGSALQNFQASTNPEGSEGDAGKDVAVLVVSWMRDLKFWQDEVRRVAGIDISKPLYAKRFGFVDDCFNASPNTTSLSDTQSRISSTISKLSLTTSEVQQQQQDGPKKILLILDQPDLLLATGHPTLTSQDLSTFLLTLRSIPQIHSTYLSLSVDLPLVTAASPEATLHTTPLETDSAAFIVTQAHASRVVFSIRELETGAAKDVSGVLRLTRGGDYFAVGGEEDDDQEEGDDVEEVKEVELLYLLQRDGGLKVFQRGE